MAKQSLRAKCTTFQMTFPILISATNAVFTFDLGHAVRLFLKATFREKEAKHCTYPIVRSSVQATRVRSHSRVQKLRITGCTFLCESRFAKYYEGMFVHKCCKSFYTFF